MSQIDLSEREHTILKILGTSERWISRNEIAAKMGKKRLNPNDIAQLESLILKGLAESDKQPIPNNNIATRWMYRTLKE